MKHKNQTEGKVPRLAVTGATGELGGRVAARLSKLGVAQRLVVRDPKRAPQLPGAKRIGPYNCTAHVAEKEYFLAIWNRHRNVYDSNRALQLIRRIEKQI